MRDTTRRYEITLIVMSVLMTILWTTTTTSAWAQNCSGRDSTGDTVGCFLSSTTGTVTTTTTELMVVLSTEGLTTTTGALLSTTYMRQNEAELMAALHTGMGNGVEDLARFYGVPDAKRDAFAQLLRDHREHLLQDLGGPRGITLEQALALHHKLVNLIAMGLS